MEDPGLVVDGFDLVGLELEHPVILLYRPLEKRSRLFGSRLALGHRQQEVAQVEAGDDIVQGLGRLLR